ncbi:Rib/alpha-like domain-containing protein [Gardnerella sp. KA00735]|uniref:HYR domain-containing protein n=1 Tax=Gardnerella sp. KA00735 TaxID=1973156 RepID=UPI000C9EDD61|nr:Rib/alpha-like domain-containing protein [Gardnerella sp. KA00735]PNP90013.1 hypothetical protein BFS08_03610 [Gardnerella sp. KA00735]
MTTVNPSKHTSSKSSKKRSAHKVHTLPLATMAALLTAATCLGSQPAMAVPTNIITTPTYTATAKKLTKATGVVYQDRETDVVVNNPDWLKTLNILEFQRYRSTNDENKDNKKINSNEHGSDEYNTLIKKTDMYAHIETIDGAKYLVFDVFFNNDAQSMVTRSKRQWYIWQVPYQIAKLNSDGSFANDTIRDLRFDAYKLKDASQNDKLKRKMNFTLSRDFAKFEKVENQSTSINFPNDSEKNFGVGKPSRFQYSLGPNLVSDDKYGKDMKNLFHENHDDYALSKATYPAYPYSGKNYGIGIQTSEVNLAFHMHAAVKLNSTAINENAKTYDEKYANIHNAWTWADSATYGSTTSSSYVWLSGRDPESDEDKKLQRHKDDSKAPKIYYNGTEISDKTKTIKLKEGEKLSFTTTDDKGYIEKFSISGLTDTPITKQGVGSEDKPLPSDDITVTNDMNNKTVTITSEDGSGNVTTRKVKVKVTKKPKLSKEHPLTGKTITTTVGEQLPPLAEIDNFVTVKDGGKLDKQPTLSWKDTTPNTNTVGVFTHEITGTYSDNSTSTATVIINVKPKKPVIDTDLTNLAGKKGQKVTVSVGDGIPKDDKVTTTVKLFDKNGKEIGSTTTINNGKAEITVNDGIPEGAVYATTTVTKPDKQDGPKKTIPGFELISENSDKKQATAPKDNEKPTITATADSLSVAVGQDLKIHIVAKDDVKVEEVPNAQALMQGLGLELNELSSRIKSSQTTNTDKEKDFDLTVKNMQPKEVGTHTITFTVKDSAGNTGTTTLTITVNPTAPTITVPADGKDQGSATITPATDTDTLEITYTPEGETNPKTITVKKGTDGKWKKGDNTPEGVTIDENTGKVTIPANKIKDGSKVTAKDKKGENTSDEATGNAGKNPTTSEAKPAAPTVTPKDNGSVEVTPAADTDTLEITYTPEGENTTPTNFTVKKENGKWKGENTPEGVTVDENTGKVTIPANKVKDGSDVKAKDKKGNNTSSETTGKAGNNDGNSGSGDSGSGSEAGNSNSSESDSGNDSKSNNAGNASTGASGSNASTKSDNRVPAKHSSQLVKTGAEVERVGLISAMIGVLGAAAAFFSRKKNRE